MQLFEYQLAMENEIFGHSTKLRLIDAVQMKAWAIVRPTF